MCLINFYYIFFTAFREAFEKKPLSFALCLNVALILLKLSHYSLSLRSLWAPTSSSSPALCIVANYRGIDNPKCGPEKKTDPPSSENCVITVQYQQYIFWPEVSMTPGSGCFATSRTYIQTDIATLRMAWEGFVINGVTPSSFITTPYTRQLHHKREIFM